MPNASPGDLIEETVGFWWVWTKTGSMPRRFHESETDAFAEAARLAKKNPDRKFIVLHGYRKFSVAP
jgi:hypothetical protein